MQTTLRPADFIKVKRFIDKETREYKDTTPIVKELSPVELYVGNCHIEKEDDIWTVKHAGCKIIFNSKRNAMYYAFLVGFKDTRLIPELMAIDCKLGSTQNDIVRLKHMLAQPKIKVDGWKTGLYHNKLSEAVAKYQKAKNDMHNWMDYAKYIN
jgi:hypothetical protein